MKIQELFARDIHRSINGVVKADQLDESSVWQELDEFVVTQELSGHLSELVAVLIDALDNPANAANINGIWVSGFFGCGKSHFIKVLSYLLENAEHSYDGKSKKAVDFFANKLGDAVLFADLKKIVSKPTSTILFNIDSKADHQAGRDALLQVFLKVLNEKQGFSGDHPHIAHMERHLEEKGLLATFHTAFEREARSPWVEERDAWDFHRDQVIIALAEALDQSSESAEKWVDNGESNFSLTIENFAKWAKAYLDRQEEGHRLMFLVDEVGQFIGNDTHLMLNLQTITEKLGTVCDGRAWVAVTSQEDLDAVLGDLNEVKQEDYSKIQGRFITRLSLSSRNVDEVIKRRLLAKQDGALPELAQAYDGKHDILRNQLSFVNSGMTFEKFNDEDDFAACYPFAAYQFNLVQKVFESIRKAGATGLHLSQGERSTLDAFQGAAKAISDLSIGALVPFYRFYPAVQGFLDTVVKRTIDRAKDNHALEDFDATILQVLFLIRYIDELPGNIDNLVTLCIDEIDADRLALRKKIASSLERLEGETLIARNGELYFFLTNEERDIGREIKKVEIPSGSEERKLGELLFQDLLGDVRKHTFSVTGRDFSYTRLCDDHPIGSRLEGGLEVAFVSPLGDRHQEFGAEAACVLHTSESQGRVLIRLPDHPTLARELRTYLQTDSYVTTKNTGSLPETTKNILRAPSEDNRERRKRIVTTLGDMLTDSSFYASGEKLDVGRADPKICLSKALEYLIQNAYPKMGYIDHLHENPKQEIQSTLRANNIEQTMIDGAEKNIKALDELRDYLRLCTQASKKVVLHEMLEKRFGQRPFGWPELETVLLVSRLAVLREVHLVVDSRPLSFEKAYDYLTATSKQRKVVISLRETVKPELIKKAQNLGKELFGQQGPSAEDTLFEFLKSHLDSWNKQLGSYEPLAKTGRYPGLKEIQVCQSSLRKLVEEDDSLRFLKRFAEGAEELKEVAEDIQDLNGFYTNQKHSWEKLRIAVEELNQNRLQLEAHETAGPALKEMEEILGSARPYNLLHKVAELTQTARSANNQLISNARGPAVVAIQKLIDSVEKDLAKVSADDALKRMATAELKSHLNTATTVNSIAHIAQALQASDAARNRAVKAIEEFANKPAPNPTGPVVPEPKPKIKRRILIDAKLYWQNDYIETTAEMESFLSSLRNSIQSAIDDGKRIQIK